MMDHYIIKEADDTFRRLIEHGKASLTVFRKRPYQMIDAGEALLFAALPGFLGDEPNALDINAVYDFEHPVRVHGRKHVTIKKADITAVEIGGTFCDYFIRRCGYVQFTVKQGRREKKVAFWLPGDVNQFVVRDFLQGICPITIRSDETYPKGLQGRHPDRSEPTVIGALVKHFNRKGRAVNVLHWMLAAVSCLLTLLSVVIELPYGALLRGIAALMPLLIDLNYLRHNGVLRLVSPGFFSPGGGKQSPYRKGRAACFGKVVVPTALLLSELHEFSLLLSFADYAVGSIAAAIMLMGLFELTVPKRSYDLRRRRMVVAMMCCFYAFTSLNAVNRMAPQLVSSEVIDPPGVFGRAENATGRYYGDVIMIGDERRFEISEEEYNRLENHELSVRVEQYEGLLRLRYYEFALVEIDDEAKRQADFLDRKSLLTNLHVCG